MWSAVDPVAFVEILATGSRVGTALADAAPVLGRARAVWPTIGQVTFVEFLAAVTKPGRVLPTYASSVEAVAMRPTVVADAGYPTQRGQLESAHGSYR